MKFKHTELIERLENWLPGAEGWGKWRDIGQRVQTLSYKMYKFWRSNYSIVTMVNNIVSYTLKLL